MAEETGIEWADATFNPWIGCTKVSPGCDHCYAEARMDTRLHVVQWGAGAPRKRTSAANWKGPVHWNAAADQFEAAHGRRRRVFCASLADVFDNAVDPQWREDLFALILATPRLDWMLLTKRIGNVGNMLPVPFDFEKMYPNVWIGASIVNREEMLRDGPKLNAVQARVRFWSVEPMLGDLGTIPLELLPDWGIVGGESGNKARPMSIRWVRSMRDQFAAAGRPLLFKQWGEWAPAGLRPSETAGRFAYGDWEHDPGRFVQTDRYPRHFISFGARAIMEHVGKKAAGRRLDGQLHDGYPVPS